jgi:hypothetical protein
MPTGEMSIMVNLLDENSSLILEEPHEVGSVWIQSTESTFDLPANVEGQETLRIGEKISLVGYEVKREGKDAQETLKTTLYWRANSPVERSYKVFVHVYDEEGRVVAQRDRVPALGIRPTTSWESGEVIADRYHIELSRELPPGTYSIATGMYDAASGRRLPVLGSDGERLSDDRVVLEYLDISD